MEESTEQNNPNNSESAQVQKSEDNGKQQSSSSSSLGKRRKSQKSKKSHAASYIDPNINYKNLDEWLENSIKGMQLGGAAENFAPPMNGSPIPSAFAMPTNPFINSHPLFNPILPPYMATARPYEQMMNHSNLSNFANPMSSSQYEYTSLPPMSSSFNNSNGMSQTVNGSHKDTSSRSSTNNNATAATPYLRYLSGDANSMFMGRQHPVGPQPSASTPNLLSSDHNKTTATNTSDESDDTKESTSISKASLKLDESQSNNIPSLTKNDLMNALNDNNNTSANSNTLLLSLMKQMSMLQETNTKIFHNLQETKVELDALKMNMNAPLTWGLRHRRDSISGMSLHSQPVGHVNSGYPGTQSPAPTYHSTGNYQPGVVTDVIREVREGTRVREEALLNRVKNMIEERQWSINETNLRVVRELEELKIQVHQIRLDNKHTEDKVARLESELTSLRNVMTHSMSFMRPTSANFDSNDPVMLRRGSNFRDDQKRLSLSFNPMSPEHHLLRQDDNDTQLVQLERDTLELRRELQDAIANKKASENKILALEKLVTSLKHRMPVNIPVQESYQGMTSTLEQSTSPTPQKAVSVQSVTPKSILTNSLSLNGPVTDL
ncbi:uncharacterized protein LOC134838149 [Culicoides brevitarsis]|uniref:uncharacterized protein LOC134838149 n=1 Tax=Culicoides brevitarsis TaxID=469753 RepID=UPI00307B63FC